MCFQTGTQHCKDVNISQSDPQVQCNPHWNLSDIFCGYLNGNEASEVKELNALFLLISINFE